MSRLSNKLNMFQNETWQDAQQDNLTPRQDLHGSQEDRSFIKQKQKKSWLRRVFRLSKLQWTTARKYLNGLDFMQA